MAALAVPRGIRARPPQPCAAPRRARGRRGASTLGTLGAAAVVLAISWRAWHSGGDVAGGPQVDTPAFVLGDKFAKQAAPPTCSFAMGFALYFFGGGGKASETAAIVMIYFGAQTGMNLYMKSVFSQVVVEEGLKGIPIGLLLSSIQQFVAFITFCVFLLVGKLFSIGYQVRKLTSNNEILAVLLFSVSFALNIGLNNFSLSLLAISINMLIRSCLPLSTQISQWLYDTATSKEKKAFVPLEWLLMLTGVVCAALATYAKSQATGGGTGDSAALVMGVIVCVASIFSGALNMVLAVPGVRRGTKMKLNAVDSVCYMALPAGLVLLVPALLVPHPMSRWEGFEGRYMTDWEAATVALSLLLGLESVPAGGYGTLFLLAVLGNLGAFTGYSLLKTKAK
ncbi:unnamed protein product [Prorocentrum cordatum]|uniref:Protein RFT1 homolog n=1 Tax=Prorocentrum cordatum TaxID=2364126 RepID=A0ABN9RTG0_9DINO|nr:unnamed protein product [Polarella glacialis]